LNDRCSGTLVAQGGRFTPFALPRLVLLAATLVVAAITAGEAPAAPPSVRPTQELVTLLAVHAVRSTPHADAASHASIPARRPITGVPTVLPVLAHAAGGWLQVRLPGRPNGGTGWISARATTTSVTRWQILVDTSRRLVLVYLAGHLLETFPAVVGKPSTPTPAGAFFVEEAVRLAPTDVGAPFALALSARSNVLQEFDGGPGQIALHGLANVGGLLGTAASHGCIRLDGNAMRWLAGRIGAGVPVTVR
jgi:lipoprotein-anchoring transpeptidase ErfK/SrfK